jgi:hypothetical protein
MLESFAHVLRWHNLLFESRASNNSSCPTKPIEWCVNYDGCELCVRSPTLVPTCILALIIGLTCSNCIRQLPGAFPSRWFYQTAFFLFGIMMTSAGILHCFLPDHRLSTSIEQTPADASFPFLQLFVTVVDVGLTSNIAVTFLFAGLCDVRVFSPQSLRTRHLLFATYLLVFLLWTLSILQRWTWATLVLYDGVIVVCCFIYLLTQVFLRSARDALSTLVIGGVYGGLGLFAITFGAASICRSEGPFWSQYVGPEFIWFLFSDISMAFVYMYVSRVNEQRKSDVLSHTSDIEKNPGKF